MEFSTRFGMHSQTTQLLEDPPHTLNGLRLDQKDSGPRGTPGKRSSIHHISHVCPYQYFKIKFYAKVWKGKVKLKVQPIIYETFLCIEKKAKLFIVW